ncbi:LysR family transcriptional regulator [Vibrio mediterranei]|uniref:LysR family transcriptional regulator n=1 Tax=Vibrio mediterranei TaxID=689 RepID=UPI001EFEC20D|nr:LysR family transcriptional regulator [Vibrio mediterranei]
MKNYKLLPILHEILQTQNLTEASERLNVTQPALSQSFQQIKEEFNDPIMVREGRRYILTEKGEELARRLPELLEAINSLYQKETFVPKQYHGNFNLAYTTYLAPYLMPLLYPSLEQQAPNVYCEYRILQSSALDELANEQLDLAIVMANDVPENLHMHLLGKDKYVAVMSHQHSLRHTEWSTEDYANQSHIQVHNVTDTKGLIQTELDKMGCRRWIAGKVPTFCSAIQTVVNTQAILTIPLHLAAIYQKQYPIVIRELPFDCPTHQYCLVWHAKKHHSAAHKWLRDLVTPLLQQYLKTSISQGEMLLTATDR